MLASATKEWNFGRSIEGQGESLLQISGKMLNLKLNKRCSKKTPSFFVFFSKMDQNINRFDPQRGPGLLAQSARTATWKPSVWRPPGHCAKPWRSGPRPAKGGGLVPSELVSGARNLGSCASQSQGSGPVDL